MILFADTFRELHKQISEHNAQKELKEKVRSNHKAFLQSLVRILQKQVQSLKEVDETDLFISTNRKHLASLLNCSIRSINNYIDRMVKLGVIKKIFRGSKANFFIKFKWDFLRLRNLKKRETSKAQETADIVGCSGVSPSVAKIHKMQSLHHRDTSTSIKQTKKVVCKSIDFHDSLFFQKNGNTHWQIPFSPHFKPLNTDNLSPLEQKKVAPARPADYEKVQKALEYAQRLWAYMYNMIYLHPRVDLKYITENERIKAQAELLKLFYNSDKSMFLLYGELIGRVGLVVKYLDKTDRYKKRFIPIPSVYLDPNNENGFAFTAEWYKEHERRKKHCNETIKNRYQQEKNTVHVMQASFRKYINGGANLISFNQAVKYLQGKGAESLLPILVDFQNNYKPAS